MTVFVADYSWQHPTPDTLTGAGYGAVMRYLARRVDAKLLQAAEVQRLHAAGIGIGLVWETWASRAGEGATAGTEDVTRAEALADDLGVPAGTPIFYAVDYDTGPDTVRPYFAAVLAGARRPVGVYGSFRVVEGLPEVPWVWQTAAWSAGRISERAHLYQRGQVIPGTDHNVVYGQVPFWLPGGQVMLINPTVGRVSRGFSRVPVVNPATGVWSSHLGVDVAAPVGTPIRAIAAGKVKGVRSNSFRGDTRPGLLPQRTGDAVYYAIDGGVAVYAGHVSKVLVAAGDTVAAGQVIALVGDTGMVTGPHLHLEVHVGGTAVDPVPWLAARGVTAGVDPYSVAYIKTIQELLNAVAHAGLRVDGDLGPKTLAAVEAYQAGAGLVIDGDPGPKTLASLRAASTPTPPTPEETPMPTIEEIRDVVRDVVRDELPAAVAALLDADVPVSWGTAKAGWCLGCAAELFEAMTEGGEKIRLDNLVARIDGKADMILAALAPTPPAGQDE